MAVAGHGAVFVCGIPGPGRNTRRTADGGGSRPLHGRSAQVGEMVGGESCGVVTLGAGKPLIHNMQFMLTYSQAVTVVLRGPTSMAGCALSVHGHGSGLPIRGYLAAVAADIRAGEACGIE